MLDTDSQSGLRTAPVTMSRISDSEAYKIIAFSLILILLTQR